jgi:hypothetical protein
MDTSAEIRAIFDTVVNGATAVAAKSQWLTLTNSKLTVGQKIFQGSPTGSPQTTVIAQTLFPFLDGYKAYAGQCSTNNPALAPTNNSALLPTYTPTPGQILTMTTANDIRVPSINVRIVTSGTGSPPAGFNGATIFVYSADSGCATTFPTQTSASKTYGSTTYPGAIPEPGFPYGNYKVCAQRTVTGVTTHGHADVLPYAATTTHPNETVVNTNPAGNAADYTTTGSSIRILINQSGACHNP